MQGKRHCGQDIGSVGAYRSSLRVKGRVRVLKPLHIYIRLQSVHTSACSAINLIYITIFPALRYQHVALQ